MRSSCCTSMSSPLAGFGRLQATERVNLWLPNRRRPEGRWQWQVDTGPVPGQGAGRIHRGVRVNAVGPGPAAGFEGQGERQPGLCHLPRNPVLVPVGTVRRHRAEHEPGPARACATVVRDSQRGKPVSTLRPSPGRGWLRAIVIRRRAVGSGVSVTLFDLAGLSRSQAWVGRAPRPVFFASVSGYGQVTGSDSGGTRHATAAWSRPRGSAPSAAGCR
jgi:hypothetical protein